MSVVGSNAGMHFLNSCKADLTKLICINFGKSEFFNILIFNWFEALYSAYSSISWHLDFIRAILMILCSFKYGAFLKVGSCVFMNTRNTEFYAPIVA